MENIVLQNDLINNIKKEELNLIKNNLDKIFYIKNKKELKKFVKFIIKIIYKWLNNNKKEIIYLLIDKCYEHFKNNKGDMLLLILITYSDIYKNNCDFKEQYNYLEKAYKIIKKKNKSNYVGLLFLKFGKYFKNKDLEISLKYFIRSVHFFKNRLPKNPKSFIFNYLKSNYETFKIFNKKIDLDNSLIYLENILKFEKLIKNKYNEFYNKIINKYNKLIKIKSKNKKTILYNKDINIFKINNKNTNENIIKKNLDEFKIGIKNFVIKTKNENNVNKLQNKLFDIYRNSKQIKFIIDNKINKNNKYNINNATLIIQKFMKKLKVNIEINDKKYKQFYFTIKIFDNILFKIYGFAKNNYSKIKIKAINLTKKINLQFNKLVDLRYNDIYESKKLYCIYFFKNLIKNIYIKDNVILINEYDNINDEKKLENKKEEKIEDNISKPIRNRNETYSNIMRKLNIPLTYANRIKFKLVKSFFKKFKLKKIFKHYLIELKKTSLNKLVFYKKIINDYNILIIFIFNLNDQKIKLDAFNITKNITYNKIYINYKVNLKTNFNKFINQLEFIHFKNKFYSNYSNNKYTILLERKIFNILIIQKYLRKFLNKNKLIFKRIKSKNRKIKKANGKLFILEMKELIKENKIYFKFIWIDYKTKKEVDYLFIFKNYDIQIKNEIFKNIKIILNDKNESKLLISRQKTNYSVDDIIKKSKIIQNLYRRYKLLMKIDYFINNFKYNISIYLLNSNNVLILKIRGKNNIQNFNINLSELNDRYNFDQDTIKENIYEIVLKNLFYTKKGIQFNPRTLNEFKLIQKDNNIIDNNFLFEFNKFKEIKIKNNNISNNKKKILKVLKVLKLYEKNNFKNNLLKEYNDEFNENYLDYIFSIIEKIKNKFKNKTFFDEIYKYNSFDNYSTNIIVIYDILKNKIELNDLIHLINFLDYKNNFFIDRIDLFIIFNNKIDNKNYKKYGDLFKTNNNKKINKFISEIFNIIRIMRDLNLFKNNTNKQYLTTIEIFNVLYDNLKNMKKKLIMKFIKIIDVNENGLIPIENLLFLLNDKVDINNRLYFNIELVLDSFNFISLIQKLHKNIKNLINIFEHKFIDYYEILDKLFIFKKLNYFELFKILFFFKNFLLTYKFDSIDKILLKDIIFKYSKTNKIELFQENYYNNLFILEKIYNKYVLNNTNIVKKIKNKVNQGFIFKYNSFINLLIKNYKRDDFKEFDNFNLRINLIFFNEYFERF